MSSHWHDTTFELTEYVLTLSLQTGLRVSEDDIESIYGALDGQAFEEPDAEDCGYLLEIGRAERGERFPFPRALRPFEAKHRRLVQSYFLIRSILENNLPSTARAIASGADVNARCWLDEHHSYFPLVQAAVMGAPEIAKLLVESGADVDQQQRNGESALANAANVSSPAHFEIARYLLEHGANPNVRAHHGLTPLAVANDARTVKLLLDHGANPNLPDSDGDLPIVARIDHRDHESVLLLVEAGTDLDGLNGNGVSARAHAEMRGVPLQRPKAPHAGMLRQDGGKKYLDIDGAHAVVHACSTVENYLDRYANDGIGNIELRWFQDGVLSISRPGGVEQQECCYCGMTFQIEPRFPNTSADVECSHCGKGQALYVIQMPAGLEQALGMENRLGGGYTTTWLTVPLPHPEFSTLLATYGVVAWKSPNRLTLPQSTADTVEQDLSAAGVQYKNTWQDIVWFEGSKGGELWPWYRETLSGVEILTEM